MNIAIIGSGLTGSLAAISLANAGCRVDLYERLSDEELINRDRTYAITHSSRKILQKFGIWSKIISDINSKIDNIMFSCSAIQPTAEYF